MAGVPLAGCAFTLATILQPRAVAWSRSDDSGGLLQTVLGDGKRLFANHFLVKADVSFHGGYYPSIFDSAARPKDRRHLTESEEGEHHEHSEEGCTDPSHDHSHAEEGCTDPSHAHNHAEESCTNPNHAHSQHEKEMALGKPHDWIDAFGRRFIITEHKHLEGGDEREILPWLKIAADLNPDQPDTYAIAAYWLRDMNRSKEAEAFLREGLRNVPDSYELYFELGRLYQKDRNDPTTARNLWDLALNKWLAAEKAGKQPHKMHLEEITVHLSRVEESLGHLERAVKLLEIAASVSPNPETLRSQISEMRERLSRTARTNQ
jgi:hypothetical protein